MTSVNITALSNTVVVTENGSSTVVTIPQTSVVTAVTAGPQGPAGLSVSVDDTAKIDKSLVYYDAASATFKADAVWTTTTIVDGANF